MFSALITLARESSLEPATTVQHRDGRALLVAHAERGRYPVTAAKRWPIFAAAAALAGVCTVWVLRPTPIRYVVRGGNGPEGPYVSAPFESSADVSFSDGTEVSASPGSRLRVDEMRSDGGRVLVEKGSASAHVVHRSASKWWFVAGPFEVRVTGTRFDLNWDPLTEELDLKLRDGSVEVRSSLGQGPISVRAGQRFRASVSTHSMTMTDVDSAPDPAPPPAAVNAKAPEPSRDASGDPSTSFETTPVPQGSPGGRPARKESWQDLMTNGQYEAIVTAALARGIDSCVSTCSAVDLRALAEAARYTSRVGLAGRSLRALRQRFPGAQSAAAALLLGRTYEAGNQFGVAQRWYETYLAESPDGEFAAEAFAGKMRTVAATRGAPAAKPIAVEYLRRYPQGVHVKSARKYAGAD